MRISVQIDGGDLRRLKELEEYQVPDARRQMVERGMEATSFSGEGLVVVADDPELEWPKVVLANLQATALAQGFFVQRMMSQVHSYHLDDAPDLRSCNVILKAKPGNGRSVESQAISDPERLAHFYGRGSHPRVHFVREALPVDEDSPRWNERGRSPPVDRMWGPTGGETAAKCYELM